MKLQNLIFVAALVALAVPLPVRGDTIYESATLGATGQTTGDVLAGGSFPQFIGARFAVTQPDQVTEIGGHLGNTNGTLFGAIISLSSSTALPSGSPFNGPEVVASTTFNAGSPSSDFLTPLSATLTPGEYALVLGSGEFGASSTTGFMPTDNTDLPGASFFTWTSLFGNGSWQDSSTTGLDFQVIGNAVPEPGTLALLGAAGIGLLVVLSKHRRRPMRKFIMGALGFRSCRDGFGLRQRISLGGAVIALLLVSGQAKAQTFTTLLTFNGTNGADPMGDLTLSGTTLYGMTEGGGTTGDGNIFSIGTDGSGFQNLLSFSGTNGQYPAFGNLAISGTTLYGMTRNGGTAGDGNIFSVGTNGSGFQNLLSFSGTNGQLPFGSLTLSGTTLYGMTLQGGTAGNGSIFSIGTNGSGFQNLLSFSGTNGMNPYGNLTLSGTTLYGMTLKGGTAGNGNIFSIGTNGSGFQNLLSFSGTNGMNPFGSLTLSGTTLYGMTFTGGNIFSIGTNGSSFQNLLSFSGTNGTYPEGSLTLSGTTLYGMTPQGGTAGFGNIFSIGTNGSGFQNLFSFDFITNGMQPQGSMTMASSATLALTSSVNTTIISGGTATLAQQSRILLRVRLCMG